MDPISAAIAGMFTLGGGLISSSAQTAANEANIQQAQYSATGAYLPQLVANAKRAGINPLAVLPGGGGSANIQPVSAVGDAMSGLGQNLSRMSLMTSPHQAVMDQLEVRRARAAAEGAELENIKTRHDLANTVGSPKLGHVQIGQPRFSDTVRRAAGVRPDERLDFPFNIGAQGGNIFQSILNSEMFRRAGEEYDRYIQSVK